MKESIPTATNKPSRAEKVMKPKHEAPEEKQLIGTFTLVLLIGGFLLATWFGVFSLYLNRL
ncbi:cytochrome c oxidase subunit 2A [Bacillus horti]|uniref:Cytochrome c oxidase subunit 2A n=1 Tax=Caldalkalibacillus horti TaxID=77523 RepID=A0ABT9VTK8_9BACI|nr:cytochrome c oxidase subunit 2A [Bacillus horti]MDQ0164309.1 hypothetical protein [Bacillus horti]